MAFQKMLNKNNKKFADKINNGEKIWDPVKINLKSENPKTSALTWQISSQHQTVSWYFSLSLDCDEHDILNRDKQQSDLEKCFMILWC